MRQRTQLLIIDPQNDFCDLPPDWRPSSAAAAAPFAPSLPVAGAHADMQRLAQWIAQQSPQLDGITITLDSHQAYDIAHPTFWQQGDGSAVPPFTTITAAQMRAGSFRPRNPDERQRTLAYLDALEAQGRYTLMVWPLHCEIGSIGHGVHADVLNACRQWQSQRQRAVHHVFKGMNPWTEHYSALRAEVPDPQDPATGLNTALLQQLAQADTLVIAGEAGSHCVRATTEHIVQNIAPLWGAEDFSRIVLLTDCISPVAGFEAAQDTFLQQMRAVGVRCTTSHAFNL
ncbi:nicotinamidase-related amidase [Comamonas sp. BIGb0152]|uniref:cysteine hydrolase n=1 Tax=Comamonas sp. BIGb0152 TaxID=2940601 RepID=UPI00216A65ED|nr:cysteine hydrolase [Comamonas sp. BIGb0152]MCS4292378.1 nicotinamidase-related amidase [Comamonas sp. BIGb0152]